MDAETFVPYGYADAELWNRPLKFTSKCDRDYSTLPIEKQPFG